MEHPHTAITQSNETPIAAKYLHVNLLAVLAVLVTHSNKWQHCGNQDQPSVLPVLPVGGAPPREAALKEPARNHPHPHHAEGNQP